MKAILVAAVFAVTSTTGQASTAAKPSQYICYSLDGTEPRFVVTNGEVYFFGFGKVQSYDQFCSDEGNQLNNGECVVKGYELPKNFKGWDEFILLVEDIHETTSYRCTSDLFKY